MQKDFHFYVTYALARKAGLGIGEAEKIAWADEHTDRMTKPGLHGIQTQSARLGNWGDRQIQLSVLVPFHFVPCAGDWIVWPNSERAVRIVTAAEDPFELGIALHALQDTFSHQGFTGWQEKANACYGQLSIEARIPNIGHAEMQIVPDIVSRVWRDPRTKKKIDNRVRAMACARETYEHLCKYAVYHSSITTNHLPEWFCFTEKLKSIFREKSYDKRKDLLRELGGAPKISYKALDKTFRKKYKKPFVKAARKHLAAVLKSL